MKPHDRVIDPRSLGQGVREERLGAIPERALRTQQERDQKFDRMNRPLVTVTLGPWYLEDVPANSSGAGMRLGQPTAAAAWNSSGTGVEITQYRAGRVLGAVCGLSADVTAGSATVGVRVSNGTPIPITDCRLDVTNPRRLCVVMPWAAGIAFAAGESIEPVWITDSGFLPITADSLVSLFVAFEAVQ